jgi:subtilisin family serine protease
MRTMMWMMIAAAGANLAQGQVRLPNVQLPVLPTQKLTQAIGQTAGNSLEQLSDVRHLLNADLIRANPHTLAADPHGNPIVRDELLAVSPTAEAMEAARTMGFRIIREQADQDLDIRVVVLQPPAGMRAAKALQQLRNADPNGSYDFNHIYTGVGQPQGRASPGTPPPDNSAADVSTAATGRSRVGLIDSGVDVGHPVFSGVLIHSWGCQNRIVPSAHGTAVASLLAGQSTGFRGVLKGAELYAADVYCGEPTGGAADALAAAFSWLAQQHVAVINISLVGPDNAVLARIVRVMCARGYLLVAAVGNDGPAAPPLFPASYPHVIGVTAVDAHRRVLIEAARGKQVMFAAPGADMTAAAGGAKYSPVRGTSFAAPIVAALLAEMISVPDVSAGEAAVDSLARQAIDLGPPGRDLTYGFGLVGAERIFPAKD